MTATPALHKQIECYRMMTGEERLAIALRCMKSLAISRGREFVTTIPKQTLPK